MCLLVCDGQSTTWGLFLRDHPPVFETESLSDLELPTKARLTASEDQELAVTLCVALGLPCATTATFYIQVFGVVFSP